MFENEAAQAAAAVRELVETAGLKAGDLLVVGCSSSEIVGDKIGTNSSLDAAKAVFAAIYGVVQPLGIFLAAQCCEHLNRALIIEREYAERAWLDTVNVVPQPKAGGSFATSAYAAYSQPVAVEHIRADAGIDIGSTLIGMHLREVAVPVRLSVKTVGNATVTAARTRAKFIGGERAHYNADLM